MTLSTQRSFRQKSSAYGASESQGQQDAAFMSIGAQSQNNCASAARPTSINSVGEMFPSLQPVPKTAASGTVCQSMQPKAVKPLKKGKTLKLLKGSTNSGLAAANKSNYLTSVETQHLKAINEDERPERADLSSPLSCHATNLMLRTSTMLSQPAFEEQGQKPTTNHCTTTAGSKLATYDKNSTAEEVKTLARTMAEMSDRTREKLHMKVSKATSEK